VLDNYGHFMTYGEAVGTAERQAGAYLPEGLVEGCRLKRDVRRDAVLTFDDVHRPPHRMADRLYEEQTARFSASAAVSR